MRNKLYILFAILSVFILASCATKTPETITVTEVVYEPVALDISEPVDLLFGARPALKPDITIPPETDLVQESLMFAMGYKTFAEDWQDYAMRLEDFITELETSLKN